MTPTELSFAGWQNRHSPSKSRPREFAAYAFLVNNLRKARGKTLGRYCWIILNNRYCLPHCFNAMFTSPRRTNPKNAERMRSEGDSKVRIRVLLILFGLFVFSTTAFGQVTSLTLNSDPGDFVGGGQFTFLTPTDGSFSAQQNFDQGVSISFTELQCPRMPPSI